MKITERKPLGNSGISVPEIIYGTSYLGNLYEEIPYSTKLELMKKWFECTEKPVVIDTAGKYGAGLALEMIGKGLSELGIAPGDIIISNKLGWYRVPLDGETPAFEPGIWAGLNNDAVQLFGYNEIIKCFDQGNDLLGGNYKTDLVSVHDPDEYLLAAENNADREKRFQNILESYMALFDLKTKGKVKAVGVGSKDWTIIRELYKEVKFDWVMLANSFTIYNHPEEILKFIDKLHQDGVGIINSAIFHGGFLTGGEKFDYKNLDPDSEKGKYIYAWREKFSNLCSEYHVELSAVCFHFALSHPAVAGIALNTSKPEKMNRNVDMLYAQIPSAFWNALKENGIIESKYNYI